MRGIAEVTEPFYCPLCLTHKKVTLSCHYITSTKEKHFMALGSFWGFFFLVVLRDVLRTCNLVSIASLQLDVSIVPPPPQKLTSNAASVNPSTSSSGHQKVQHTDNMRNHQRSPATTALEKPQRATRLTIKIFPRRTS